MSVEEGVEHTKGYETITIEEFDKFCIEKAFKQGPEISTFGNGRYDPYCPKREVRGILNDGRKIRAVKHLGKL